MQFFNRTILILFLLHLAGHINAQQTWRQHKLEAYKTIPCLPYVTATKNPDTMRIDIYIKIGNHQLQFVRDDSLFQAGYELTVQVLTSTGRLVSEKITSGRIVAHQYKETTNTEQFVVVKLKFLLPQGEYRLHLELFDKETRRPLRQESKLEVDSFLNQSLSASELIFFDKNKDRQPHLARVVPRFPAFRTDMDSVLYGFMYAYTNKYPCTGKIRYRISGMNQDIQYQDSIEIQLKNPITPLIIPIRQKFNFGQYILTVKLFFHQDSLKRENTFYIRWKSHSKHILNLQQSIEALIYVMDRDAHQKLLALTGKDQIREFEAFWDKRDPTPDTPKNELQEEYYRRVVYANKNFSYMKGRVDGWKTDRGRILILFGAPSDIEYPRMSGMETTQYEIWYYRNLQRRFIFRDKMGIGDYRLYRQE